MVSAANSQHVSRQRSALATLTGHTGERSGVLLIMVAGSLVAGCSTTNTLTDANVARGEAAYRVFATPPTQVAVVPTAEYRIGPRDSLAVAVFQEPDLSTPADSPLVVDAAGNISLPLVGSVYAAGKTSQQLAQTIEARLRSKYLKNPQVTVSVTKAAPQKLTVQGEVAQPGVFDINGATSLLEALALARGETRMASINEVAVFRNVNGQRMGALFDVGAIRRGVAPDPQLMPNDVVIVGHSKSRQMWQDVLSVSPLFGVFRAVTGVF
jgi:polysaccharide biosynthesis/export protein